MVKQKPSKRVFYRNRIRFEIFRRDKFKCQYCGRNIADGIKLTLDHVNPKSNNGDFTEDNLLTACRACNQGKWTDVLSGWELRELKKICDAMRPRKSIIVVA